MADSTVRKDAEGAPANSKEGEALDKILSHLDAVHKRLDAVEAKMTKADEDRKDAEGKEEKEEKKEEKADAEKKEELKDDAEEEKKEAKDDDDDRKDKPRKDAKKDDEDEEDDRKDSKHRDDARHDSLNALNLRIDELSKRVPVELSEEDRAKYVEAQAKADKVAVAFGDSAPRWMNGETLIGYRKRLIRQFQPHSADWKSTDLSKISDAAALDVIESKVYADSMTAAMHPSAENGSILREVKERDRTGRIISKFYGDPEACWGPFKMPARAVRGLTIDKQNVH